MTFTPPTKPATPSVKKRFNAGHHLVVNWRWNWKPLRVRITREPNGYIRFAWLRWFKSHHKGRPSEWREWRAYVSPPGVPFREALARYRGYAHYWRYGEY